MKRTAVKMISLILVIVLLSGIGSSQIFAAPTLLLPPQHNRVSDIGYIQNINSDDWYAKINWNSAFYPPEADTKYIDLGLGEVESGTGKLILDALKISLPGTETEYNLNAYSPEGIKHGTIYEATVRGSYTANMVTGVFTVNSQRSNPAKFLTGLHVSLELVPGTNDIKIKWDDVWDTNGRINYRILISDTKGFTQPPPVPDIVASEIGKTGSAVTINNDENKLEYIYKSALPGREYSIKVVPLPGISVACADENETPSVKIKTDILLKAQRVGYTNEGGVIWKLFWNPIVKGTTFTRVDYELYRYRNDEPQGQLFRLIPELDNYLITIDGDDPAIYSFKIDAKAYVPNSEAPIEFRSNNKVMLKEQIPQQPEAPDIVEAFADAYPEPLVYDDCLTANEASVFWTVPYDGEGNIDNDITYDIYLSENIQDVSNPPTNFKIASDITMSEANRITSKLTGKTIGYRYNLEGLKSNSTYYFVVYAKKNYLVQNPTDGFMVTMPYISRQAVKVIVTKPDTGSDRPVAPHSPPFGIEPGIDSVTYSKASLVLEKKWPALFDAASKRWKYVSVDEYNENTLLDPADPDKRIGMIVDYPKGWKVISHIIKYNDALNVVRMRNIGRLHVTYSDLSQPDIKAFEIPQQPVIIPDIATENVNQSFSFQVTGLEHNTTYLTWVTIENQNGTASDPSDAIIINTPPQIPVSPVTPTVPNDLKGIAADSFIDLFWTFIKDMDYEIKGGTSDDLGLATITQQVSYEDIKVSTFSRIEDLKPDTTYYFWIKAISTSPQGQILNSLYSNPLIIKTEAFKQPAPPTGFGVKSGAEGVTENTISYLWDAKAGFSYFLEFADNAGFENAVMTEVTGNTHTVSGLISNRRYYARVYAFESKTELRSEPTRMIMVITNKSRSEYDGSFDLDSPIAGDGLVLPAKLDNGAWVVTSLGTDSHVLAQRIRAEYGPIVKLDLSNPPAKTTVIRLDLDSGIFDILSATKKELYVKLPWSQFIIRPGTFETDEYYKQKSINKGSEFRIEAVSPATYYKPSPLMQIKTPVSDYKISYLSGNTPVSNLLRPIRVELPVPGLSAYGQGAVKTYSIGQSGSWYALPAFNDYENNMIVGELDRPGAVVAATLGVETGHDAPIVISKSMEKIQAVFNLKSLQGKSFNHKASMTQKDVLKLILDVVPTDSASSDIIQKAVRAGIINSTADVTDALSRRDKAAGMLISLYKLKTHESVVAGKPHVWAQYSDLSKTDPNYLNAYRFAVENGIIKGEGLYVYPDKIVTFGDFLVMLERTLRLCGEL